MSKIVIALNNYKKSITCYCCSSIEKLEFHHVDPKTKTYNFKKLSLDKVRTIIAEIKKCIVVCTKCHNKIHSGKITLDNPTLCKITEKKFLKIISLVQPETTKKNSYCQNCKKLIQREKDRCDECSKLLRKYYKDMTESS